MFSVYQLYKCAHRLYQMEVPVLPKLITHAIRLFWGGYIPFAASLGTNTQFGYGAMSVVIHERAMISNNCFISQGVTIGGRSGHHDVPFIGNDVFIGAGAKVLGPIKVGDGASIGANAVVTHDVPLGCTVAGVPARIIKRPKDTSEHVFTREGEALHAKPSGF